MNTKYRRFVVLLFKEDLAAWLILVLLDSTIITLIIINTRP